MEYSSGVKKLEFHFTWWVFAKYAPPVQQAVGLLSPRQPHLCCGTASTHVVAVEEHSATLRKHTSECEQCVEGGGENGGVQSICVMVLLRRQSPSIARTARTQRKGTGMAARSTKGALTKGATMLLGHNTSVERMAWMQTGAAARSGKVAGGAMGDSEAAADGEG
ncbi:hypothetical protein DFH07DRAFT_770896 [Mycena maculata]|uniref:Uncharacterized protein n=1 Tax=Mycena maculata TaxID=230809 RepID=A0AAD7NJD1_9AGAR|nr:hypothetical protein DFH07DRAFT_770896 [Mycena maculata]